MKITKVELQKNDKTRFSLFSGDEYIMSVSSENLAPYGYGEFEISEEELAELKSKEDVAKTYKMATRYTSRAMKTEKEVRDYLYRKKVDPNLFDEIINYLKDLGLIDDERYLEIYLEDRFNFSTDGSKKIIHKLIRKGFNKNDITPHLEQYREQELENLKKTIELRLSTRKNEEKPKLIRYLMNKGYEYSMINSVIGEYYDEEYY